MSGPDSSSLLSVTMTIRILSTSDSESAIVTRLRRVIGSSARGTRFGAGENRCCISHSGSKRISLLVAPGCWRLGGHPGQTLYFVILRLQPICPLVSLSIPMIS